MQRIHGRYGIKGGTVTVLGTFVFFFPQAFLDRPLLFNYMLTLTNQGASGKPPIKWQSAALKTFHLVLDLGASIGIMCR